LNCKTTLMMMKVKNYFLLELNTCLHFTSHKLFNDMASPHLDDQKKFPKIGNKTMSEPTMIILHLHQCLEKFYLGANIGWFKTYSCGLWPLSMNMMVSLCNAQIV
jgi:hypothetical protein